MTGKRLLIATQKVDLNDDILGFFHEWIVQFAQHYESVIITCLEEGQHQLPPNVEVLSLNKTEKTTQKDIAFWFLKLAKSKRKEYDHVFVHMNPEYVAIAGALWRLLGKKVSLWYTHRAVNNKLSLAEKFAHIIFTASGVSFQLPTKKLKIVGHGINVARFKCHATKSPNVLRVLSVGRITPIKNCDVLIRAAALLREKYGDQLEIQFLGGPMNPEDQQYLETLKELVKEQGLSLQVKFLGRVPNHKTPQIYCEATMTVNMTPTGGVDKTVLESMAAKTPVLTSNEAFRAYFGDYADDLIFTAGDHTALAAKIEALRNRPDLNTIAEFLEGQAEHHFAVEDLITKIVGLLNR